MKCLCAFYMVITLIIQTYSIQECTNYYIILVKEQGFPTLEPADMKTISWDYPWNASEEYKIIQNNTDCVLELTCGGIDTECIKPVKAINQSRDEFIISLPKFNTREPANRENLSTAVAAKEMYTDIEPTYTTESYNVSTSKDKSTLVTITISKEDNLNTTIATEKFISVNSVTDTIDIDTTDPSITTTEMSISFTDSMDFDTTSIISTTKKSISPIPVIAVDNKSTTMPITTDVSSTVKSLLTEVDSSINPSNPPDTEVDLTTETLLSKTESSQVETTTQINNSSGADLLQKLEEDKNSRVRTAAVIIGGLAGTSMMILLIRKILEKMQSATYRFPDPPEADTRV